MARDFRTLLDAQWDLGKFLCVGLDTDFEKIPDAARTGGVRETIVNFNRAIIEATKDIVGSYKPNSAFYEAHGELGWQALQQTISDIHALAPDVPVILDAKRGDLGNSSEGYATAAFENLDADAITVQPYQGRDAIEPFLKRDDRGVFVLCRTSNPTAREFQDLQIDGDPLYMHVARAVAKEWNGNGNCGLVVGATYPEEMQKIREAVGDLPFLIPGIGAQGGDVEKTVQCGKDSRGRGMIIASSRAIMYASSGSNFAEAARAKAQELDAAIRAAL